MRVCERTFTKDASIHSGSAVDLPSVSAATVYCERKLFPVLMTHERERADDAGVQQLLRVAGSLASSE